MLAVALRAIAAQVKAKTKMEAARTAIFRNFGDPEVNGPEWQLANNVFRIDCAGLIVKSWDADSAMDDAIYELTESDADALLALASKVEDEGRDQ